MINYKAVFLGVAAGILGAFLGGLLAGIYAGAQGSIVSAWYLEEHIGLVYFTNIIAGLACGWAVKRLEKVRLFPNLFIASTSIAVLSIIANPSLTAVLGGAYGFERVFQKALLPLAVGWAVPFVFLLFRGGASAPSQR